jgi:hypothetical protein
MPFGPANRLDVVQELGALRQRGGGLIEMERDDVRGRRTKNC